MSTYDHLPASKPTTRRASPPVYGIGWRAFVNSPLDDGNVQRTVPTVDAAGVIDANTLNDGDEVEILSWRPKSRTGALYQIRVLSDGKEWWIHGIHLRRNKEREVLSAVPALRS